MTLLMMTMFPGGNRESVPVTFTQVASNPQDRATQPYKPSLDVHSFERLVSLRDGTLCSFVYIPSTHHREKLMEWTTELDRANHLGVEESDKKKGGGQIYP